MRLAKNRTMPLATIPIRPSRAMLERIWTESRRCKRVSTSKSRARLSTAASKASSSRPSSVAKVRMVQIVLGQMYLA